MALIRRTMIWSIALTFLYSGFLSGGTVDVYTWWGGSTEWSTGKTILAAFGFGAMTGVLKGFELGKFVKP